MALRTYGKFKFSMMLMIGLFICLSLTKPSSKLDMCIFSYLLHRGCETQRDYLTILIMNLFSKQCV